MDAKKVKSKKSGKFLKIKAKAPEVKPKKKIKFVCGKGDRKAS